MCNTVLWQRVRCVICGENAALFGVCLLACPDGFVSILCGLSGWLAKFITDILWGSCDGFGRKMWDGPVCSALCFVFCSALRFVFCYVKFVRRIRWCFFVVLRLAFVCRNELRCIYVFLRRVGKGRVIRMFCVCFLLFVQALLQNLMSLFLKFCSASVLSCVSNSAL